MSHSALARSGLRAGSIILLAVILGLTSGCATTLSPELLVPNPPPVVHQTEKTITVAPVTSEKEASTVAWNMTDQFQIGTEQFQAALVKALGASGIFRNATNAGTGEYKLQTRIVSHQSHRAGFLTVMSSLVVNYRLRETSSDRVVWSDTIITEDTEEGAPFTEGVPGAAKKSLAEATRRNIGVMLENLSREIR